MAARGMLLSLIHIYVVNIGLASTPTTELAVTMEGACGGIILTASHNPRQWNALKLLNEHGEFLNKEEGNEVLRIAEAEAFEFADIDHIGSYREDNTYNQSGRPGRTGSRCCPHRCG